MKLIALLSLSLSFTTAAGAQVWSRSVSGLGKTDVVRSVESGTGGELALALDPGVGGPCVVVITKEGATGRTRCFEAGDSREYVVPLANGYLRYGTVYLDVSQPGLGKSRKGDGFATLLDRELNVVWSRHMEGSESITLTTAAATPDNGYVLAGTSGAASLVIKLRSDGALQWRRRYDLSETDRINRIEAAADGSLLAAGTGRGHPWLMKLDSQGGVAWHFMSTVEGAALSMAVQAGGAVAIAGHAERAGRLYPWIASFDHGGTVRWQKMADRPGALYKVFFHRDGSLVALGSSSVDLLEILSFAGSGELQWQRGLRLPSQSIATMTENGLVVASPVKTGLEVRRLDRKVAGDACANLLAVEVSYTFTPIKGTTSYDLDRTGIEITATPVADRGRSIPISLMKATCEPAAVAAEPTKSTVILTTSERMLLRHHAEAEALSGKARELLSKRQFSALDEWADQLRRSGETFGDGYSKLSEFYHGLTREEVGQSETEHLDLLHRWRSEAPRSAAGAVATAEALLAYAHRARGSSTAGLVSETGRRRQAELLDAAARVLEGSAEFALADPHYWVARIQLAGVSCDGLDAVVRSAAVREKRFPYIFRAASIFYLPRWCGSAAEFRGFAEFAADATKAEFGDALYALVAWTALSIEDSNALTTFGLDWNRVQRGFEDYLRRYPDATSWHHRYAYAAWRASDRARARKLFATPHLGWTQEFHTIWRSHGDYMVARNWAMSEPTEDIMRSPSPVANTPPIAARPEPAPQPPSSSSSLRRPAANSWITGAASSWPHSS